jgi:hypothetical protein
VARRRGALLAVVATAMSLGAVALPATAAHAAGPGSGTPYVVTVGDSYISGEAGRWAGNSNEGEKSVDALGPTAYDDNATHTAALIPGCDRSLSDEAFLGSGVDGKDLACSGATSATQPFMTGSDFKPGLDFYNDGKGHLGQALQLQQFAAAHNVKMVAVSIGGNDFDFSSVVQDCVEDFLTSSSLFPNFCNDDSTVTKNFTAANVAAVKAKVVTALKNVGLAMKRAGYAPSQWTLEVQDYPSPLPNGSGIRYPQSGFTRQSTGGCGFWNADATYANATMLHDVDTTLFSAATASGLTNVKTIQLQSAFNGHRLCETGVGRLEEKGLTSWKQSGAVNQVEWFQGIRTVTTVGSDYQIQESLHPDYWAQLAERNCLRQAYHAGTPKGGTCAISATGLDSRGEPNMTLH